MSGWSPVIVERFKSLFNVDGLSDEVPEHAPDGESEDAATSRLVASARIRNANDVQAVHEALAAFAFDGYREWHSYDDDDWTRGCLARTLSEDQSSYLVSALGQPAPADLASLVRTVAGQFVSAWRERAQPPGLGAVLNEANWQHSRTPGTRYYIYNGDQYLFCDDQHAGLGDWATSHDREEAAKNNATQWAPGIFYTPYPDPSLVDGVPRVYGLSEYGPWTLTEQEAVALATARAEADAASGHGEHDDHGDAGEPDEIDIQAIARQSVEQALAQLNAEPESAEAFEQAVALVASRLAQQLG